MTFRIYAESSQGPEGRDSLGNTGILDVSIAS